MRTMRLYIAVILVVLVGLAMLTSVTTVLVGLGLMLVIAGLLAYLGWTTPAVGIIVVVLRFGAFHDVIRPQKYPQFVIPFIDKVEYHTTKVQQRELTTDMDNIDRLNDHPDTGKRLPFRVLMKGRKEALFYVKKDPTNPEEARTIIAGQPLTEWKLVPLGELDDERRKAMEDDSLHAPLTGEIQVAVELRLDDENLSIRQFVENIEPENGRSRMDEVWKRIEDQCARVLQDIMGVTTLGHAREMMEVFNAHLQLRLEILVGEKSALPGGDLTDRPWGIHISDAYIKSIHPGRRVNESRADAAAAVSDAVGAAVTTVKQAEADAQKTELAAKANKIKVVLDSQAARIAEINKGKGERGRLEQVSAAMRTPEGQFAATLDVAERALTEGENKIIMMPSDLGAIGGVLSLGTHLAKSIPKEVETREEPKAKKPEEKPKEEEDKTTTEEEK